MCIRDRYTSYDIQAGVVIFLPTENIQSFRKVQFQIAVNECLLLTEVRQNYQLPTTEIPLEEMERKMIQKALDTCNGNLSAVAAQLGITRQTLYNKMKKFGL